MKAVIRFGRWRPIVGVLALGVFAFSLSLKGAPTKDKRSDDQSLRSAQRTDAQAAPAALPRPAVTPKDLAPATARHSNTGIRFIRTGRLPDLDIPVAPTVTVNPFDDEPSRMRARGELVGPWRPATMNRIAAGVCTFNIDCDDCDPCTADVCDILPFAGTGTCLNTHIGNGGGANACSDGLFCNGIETCQNGVCELPGTGTGLSADDEFQIPCGSVCAGGPRTGRRCDPNAPNCPDGTCEAAVCDENLNQCKVPCTQPVCSDAASNADAVCTTDGDCPGGTCQLLPDDVCDNGLACDGADTCNLTTQTCENAGNPCGPRADCAETTCSNGLACFSDDDCSFGTCAFRGVTGCFFGLCCTDIGGGDFTAATKRFNTAPNGPAGQRCDPADLWYSTQFGRLVTGNAIPPVCPKYSAGIMPAGDDPTGGLAVVVGPASQSPCEGLEAIGDDYTFSNGSFIDVEELVFIGGVETVEEERMLFEFYSASGEFIEDFLFASGSALARRTIEISPPLRIPPSGRVVVRAATAFAPSARIRWATTFDPPQVSTNNATTLFVDFGAGIVPVTDFVGECVGGELDGAWCKPSNGNADCDPGAGGTIGTCEPRPSILAMQLAGEKGPEPVGACCDTTGGTCDGTNPWNCNNGIFQGNGTLCRVCSNDSFDSGASCRTCAAGNLNAGDLCARNSECDLNATGDGLGSCVSDDTICRLCNAASTNAGASCTMNSECPGGACLGTCVAATSCATGACCDATGACSQTDQAGCTGTFQGFGTDCDPNCCAQPAFTGGDNCSDTTTWISPALAPGATASVTLTGDNSGATGPDSCTAAQFNSLQVGVEDVDPGWWESFSVQQCSFVRIDMCCSNPIHAPQWVVMWNACPCESTGFREFFRTENPFEPDLPSSNRGAPFCDEDNLWWQYGPIPPGTYYQPVFSSLAGAHGSYQMHITVTACPEAACCFLECSAVSDNPGAVCRVNADCPNGSCDPTCALLDQLSCENLATDDFPGKEGVYLGPPNKAVATTFCSPAVCGTGSCCPAPGQCLDEENGVPFTKSACDQLGGEYQGGIRCAGGTCMGGTRAGLSCNENGDCPSGTCTGSVEELAQRSPCPICEILTDDQCQRDPGQFTLVNVSRGDVGDPFDDPTGFSSMADDFRALENGAVSQVCIIGTYLDFQAPANANDCTTDMTVDKVNFRVSIYEDLNTLPGPLLGTTTTTVIAQGIEFTDGRDFVRQNLALDTPITGLIAGRDYWLEVNQFMDPGVEPAACSWFWLGTAEGEGNNYSLQDLGGSWGPEDLTVPPVGPADRAWCLDIANEPPPEPVRACCLCGTGCTDLTFKECSIEQKGQWLFSQNQCAGFTCPTNTLLPPGNDEPAGAITITDGTTLVSNLCATSSPAPLFEAQCEGTGTTEFSSDVWYNYIATCDGTAEFSMCNYPVNGAQDVVLAIYTNGSTTCPNPVTPTDQLGDCNDDGCFWGGTGSQLNVPVIAGQCYAVRIAGFFDDDGAQWDGQSIKITCGVVTALDPPTASSDGFDKSRYISITPTNVAGTPTTIRVEVLANPLDATTVGHVWWAGAQGTIPNAPNAALDGSLLECTTTPVSQIWTTGDLHLYGSAIVPGASYGVSMCDAAGSSCSTQLVVNAGKWGDVVSPFGGNSQPNFGDVNALVNKFKTSASAPDQPRTDLRGGGAPNTPNTPDQQTTFFDINADVGAFQGDAYPFTTGLCAP